MEERFDPETGKPIENMAAPQQVEPQVMFDPETGKPISDMAAPEQPQQPQYTAPEQAAPQQPQYTAPEQSGVRFDPKGWQ